jgi:glycosyltransferase involved in cell wall biosynthesis
MKIIHTIPRFPYIGSDIIVGGAASSLLNLAKEQGREHEITIIGNMLNAKNSSVISVDLQHLKINSNASSVFFGIEYSLKLTRALSKGPRPDIVHAHSGFAEYVLATILMKFIKMESGIIHTFYCPLPDRGIRSFLSGVLINLAVRMGIKYFVSISRNTAGSLERAGVPSSRIKIVPPTVNVERFSQRSDSDGIRQRLGISKETPLILFVGNTKASKNLEKVLEALKLLLLDFPDVRLVITTELGHKNVNNRTELLKSLVEKWNLAPHLYWVGITDEMPALMASADVLVAPFLHTFGPSDFFIAALEAMASGTPVVVSSVGGMSEIVDSSRGILIDPREAHEIAEALANLLFDKEKCHTLGNNAREYVRKNFAPSRVAAQMDAVYSEMIYG